MRPQHLDAVQIWAFPFEHDADADGVRKFSFEDHDVFNEFYLSRRKGPYVFNVVVGKVEEQHAGAQDEPWLEGPFRRCR